MFDYNVSFVIYRPNINSKHVILTCATQLMFLLKFFYTLRLSQVCDNGSLLVQVGNSTSSTCSPYIDKECTDVNLVVRQYDASLSSLLDKHAPSKRIYVVERPINDWMTDDMLVLKALRRKYESLWRKTRLTVHFDMYSESCIDVKTVISNSKSEIWQNKISDCKNFSKLLTPC